MRHEHPRDRVELERHRRGLVAPLSLRPVRRWSTPGDDAGRRHPGAGRRGVPVGLSAPGGAVQLRLARQLGPAEPTEADARRRPGGPWPELSDRPHRGVHRGTAPDRRHRGASFACVRRLLYHLRSEVHWAGFVQVGGQTRRAVPHPVGGSPCVPARVGRLDHDAQTAPHAQGPRGEDGADPGSGEPRRCGRVTARNG